MNYDRFHPDLIKVVAPELNSQELICPICKNKLRKEYTFYLCKQEDCYVNYRFKILSLTKSFDVIEFSVRYSIDSIIFVDQDFTVNNIILTIMPEHKEVVIPNFPIPFDDLDKFIAKIKIYATFS